MRKPTPRTLVIMACIAGAAYCFAGDAPGKEPRAGTASQDATARLGKRLFLRTWAPNDPRAGWGDGLGPVFNARSCVACHGLAGPGGGGRNDTNVELLSAIPARTQKTEEGVRAVPPDRSVLAAIHPAFAESNSIVLHRFGLSPSHEAWRNDAKIGRLTPAALFGEGASFTSQRTKPKMPEVSSDFRMVVSSRNSPALFGSGRIDEIPDAAIEAEAIRQEYSEVKGRVHRLKDGGIGRFGWKAQVRGLEEFVLTACANEMGLEVDGHHQAPNPLGYGEAEVTEPDMSADDCRALVSYVRSLPAPVEGPRDSWTRGRTLFKETGCNACHRPSLGGVDGIYSDMLLHDMGQGLSDAGMYYGADEESSPGVPKSQEWKTPPLWGVADSAPYLHDGRARTLGEAILQHGGQGGVSSARFQRLKLTEKVELVGFLRSLKVPPAARLKERDRLVEREEYLPYTPVISR